MQSWRSRATRSDRARGVRCADAPAWPASSFGCGGGRQHRRDRLARSVGCAAATLAGTCADSGHPLAALLGQSRYLHDLLAPRRTARRLRATSRRRVAAAAAATIRCPACVCAVWRLSSQERPRHPATRAACSAGSRTRTSACSSTAALELGSEGARCSSTSRGASGAATPASRVRSPSCAPSSRRRRCRACARDRVAGWKDAAVAACLESLARRGSRAPAPIGRVLDRRAGLTGGRGRTVRWVSRTAPRRKQPLVRALAHADGAVRLAAAASLGRVGTAAGVAALREAESRPRGGRRVRPGRAHGNRVHPVEPDGRGTVGSWRSRPTGARSAWPTTPAGASPLKDGP